LTALLAVARAIHFASLMTIFGASTYAVLLRRKGLLGSSQRGMRVLFTTAATLAIVSGISWLCMVAGQMSGRWQDALDPGIIALAATGTRFGHVFLGRLVGMAALWFMCAFGVRSDSLAISILAGLLLASLGPVSHAAAGGSAIASLGAISDAAHLLTGGFWLGGLLVLAMFVKRHWTDRACLLAGLRLFSTWGTAAVIILVITGLANAISILPFATMSLRYSYFDLLLVKVGLASVMAGLAALNRWHFTPAIGTGDEGANRHLARSIRSEIVLGFAVVAIAGLLGLLPPH